MPVFTLKLRYSLYYFLAISIYAFIFAFFPLHCKQIGFTPAQIGWLSALSSLAAIVAAPLALQVAHAIASPRTLFVTALTAALLCFLPLFVITSFPLLVLCWFFSLFFSIAANSLVDVEAVKCSIAGTVRFEQVRIYGSVGFVLINFVFGWAVQRLGEGTIIPAGGLLLLAILVAGLALRSALPPEIGRREKTVQPRAGRWPLAPLLALLAATALIYGSHSPAYMYLSLYLDALGWSPKLISLAWNLGVIAEIVLFIAFRRLESRFTLVALLRVSALLTLLRWLILLSTQQLWVLLASQLLHAFSFGAYYLASINIVRSLAPPHFQDRAQALLIACGAGLGSFCGRAILSQSVGGIRSYLEVQQLFVAAATAALIALAFTFLVPQAACNTSSAAPRPTEHGLGSGDRRAA